MLAALGGLFEGLVDRLRGGRYFVADLLYVLARLPRALARGVAGFWRELPIIARRRLVAALLVVAAVLVFAGLVVPNLPCSLPGGDRCPADDDALGLAPAGAVAYVHLNVDPDTEQGQQAADVAARTPEVSRQVIGQAARLLDAAAPLGAATEPWFTGEAAAIVLGGAGGERVQMLETEDADGARAYAESVAPGGAESREYRGVEIVADGAGGASAVIDGFLILGASPGVRAVLDVATGAEGAESLAEDPVATRALEALPDHRVAEAYVSAAGVETLVANPDGALASFEPLVDANASRGLAVAVSANDDGFALATRSLLDRERSDAEPGFFTAFEEFEPELPAELSSDTLGYLGLGEPGETVDSLLRQATVRAPGIAAGIADLIESLRGAADVDLQRDLLRALGGEAALAVVPRGPAEDGQGEGEALPATRAPTPYLEFLATDVDTEAARDALARLQGPIARAFDPELGAPSFNRRKFGDIDAEVLRLSPVAQLLYATSDSDLVIANDPAAIERLAEGDGGGLEDSNRYERTIEELPDEPALLTYLDLRGLLAFAEQSGLAEDPAYGSFAPDLRRLDSFGLTVSEDEDVLATDARLLVD